MYTDALSLFNEIDVQCSSQSGAQQTWDRYFFPVLAMDTGGGELVQLHMSVSAGE